MAVSQPQGASKEKIDAALANANLQLAVYTATGRLMSHRRNSLQMEGLGDFEALRTQANAVKRDTIDHLDYYLEEFERNVVAHGGKVVFCETGTEVADFVLRGKSGEVLPRLLDAAFG